jgi:hypothetical protein
MTVSHHDANVRQVVADTVVNLIDGGTGAGDLVFLTTGAAVVATLPFSNPAFGNANGSGVATAGTILDDESAAGGIMDNFTIQDGDASELIYGSVGTSGEDINMSNLTVGVGDTVSVSLLTYAAMA